MKQEEIIKYCTSNFADVVVTNSWGEKGIFYNLGGILKRGVYVLTIKEKDGDNDKGSFLDREGVYRVNVGIRKESFKKRFSYIPKRPAAGQIVTMDFDFTALDIIMPHPVYAWMGWVCVLNPSLETWKEFECLVQESYEYANQKFAKRKR